MSYCPARQGLCLWEQLTGSILGQEDEKAPGTLGKERERLLTPLERVPCPAALPSLHLMGLVELCFTPKASSSAALSSLVSS